MISYLAYTTVCMGILLLFYHVFLEREKMHQINRCYLVFGLIFSLSIPVIPVGLADSPIPWFQTKQTVEIQPFPNSATYEGDLSESEAVAMIPAPEPATFTLFARLAMIIYVIVAMILFIRLLRIIHMIQLKADRNPRKSFENYEMVLLNEPAVPHTFMRTIFVNRDQYLKGEIGREILLHERTHAKQRHTLDILFTETLKVLFWFNPVLYFYKKAILLNHEFLADQAVISNGTPVAGYQKLLLNTLLVQPVHGLGSNFNYKLTKKRLTMMTQSTSRLHAFIKITILIPLFVSLGLFLGCESTPSEYADEEEVSVELKIEISGSETVNVNAEEMSVSELEIYLSELTRHPDVIHMKVNEDVAVGLVTDVQNVLRKQEILKINYSTKRAEGEGDDYEVTVEQFIKAAEEYMEMEIDGSVLQELEEQYEIVMDLHNEIQEADRSTPDTPPSPPVPPSPEERLESDIQGTAYNVQAETGPPHPPARNRNLLNIIINTRGQLLVNEEPENTANMKNLVKQFVDNHDADPDLSEHPQEAVIWIKTDRQTPYDIYTELLDNIMAAYSELRDQAAREQFGVSFSSLEKGSEQREEIVEMYPRKVSVRNPIQK